MSILRICCFTFCLLASVLFSQQATFGQIIDFTSTIDGPSADRGNGTGSLGLGSATATLDTSNNLFTYSGSFSGLTSAYSAGHFHGPALPDANGPIELGLVTTLDPGGTSGTFSGSATLDAIESGDLSSELWYINIHSTTFGGGEIRGQVNVAAVPEPSSTALIGLGFVLAATRRRRS